MKRGQVCLLHYPFTDLSASKLRPAVVASIDEFNGGQDVVILPISSAPDRNDQHSIYLSDQDPGFARTGLRKASSIKWSKPLTVAKSIITRKLGSLDEPIMKQVGKNLCHLLGS